MRTKWDNLFHFLEGIGVSILTFFNHTAGIFTFILFIIYELDEDWHISDDAYIDIFYFGWGIGIGACLLILLEVL